jgi:hypothetical protein
MAVPRYWILPRLGVYKNVLPAEVPVKGPHFIYMSLAEAETVEREW